MLGMEQWSEFSEAIDAVTQRAQAEVNKSFENLLEQQACSVVLSSSGGHPVQKKAKFRFANGRVPCLFSRCHSQFHGFQAIKTSHLFCP